MKLAVLSAFVGLSFLCSALVFAAPDNSETGQPDALDEIVVTATRVESAIRDVARSVSVIDKEQIQNGQQLLGLDESLAGVPGLYMQNRYNFAQDLKISLRGFGARSSFGIRGVRIFVDDIPETLPDGQAQVDSIDLGSTSRIEVLRGPASTMYGNAAGGVIAVFSELNESAPYVEAAVAGGNYGYQRYQLKAAGAYRSLDYMLSGSHTELDGYRDFSRARGTAVNGKFGIELTDRDVLLIAVNQTDQPQAQDPGGIDATQLAADRRSARLLNEQFDAGEELSQQRIGGVYRTDRLGGTLMLRNYYVWRDFTNRLPFVAGGAVDLQRFFYGLGAQYSFPDAMAGRLKLVTGFDVDRQDDDRQRFDNNNGTVGAMVFEQNESVDSNGVFLQGQFTWSDDWSMLAGLRYDDVKFDITDYFLGDGNDSGTLDFEQWSPSVAVNYKAESGVVFASWSSSFETPTTTELANPDGTGGFNSTLMPQVAYNYEIGFKSSRASLFYEVSVFHIDLEDELIPFEIASSPGRTFYSNAGSSTRNGVEAAISWHASNGLTADLSYTWSDFTFDEFVEDGEDFGGKQLPGLPEHFAYLGLTYAARAGLSATFETLYSGSLYTSNDNATAVGSYAVSNFRLGYEWSPGDWMIRPYIAVNNIFDEQYNSNIRINALGGRYYEAAPERNVFAGIVVDFRRSSTAP
ncbi:MAG: TonB-dependent receptor [Woeseiaceae bacterium]|nr:TonB-dependent receptor [Woeseiaceae bacterium]